MFFDFHDSSWAACGGSLSLIMSCPIKTFQTSVTSQHLQAGTEQLHMFTKCLLVSRVDGSARTDCSRVNQSQMASLNILKRVAKYSWLTVEVKSTCGKHKMICALHKRDKMCQIKPKLSRIDTLGELTLFNHLKLRIVVFLLWLFYIYRGSRSSAMFLQ